MPDRKVPYKIEITAALIEQYLQGRLDGKMMHAIERRALDDPFLAEALEGFGRRNTNLSDDLDDLQSRLQAKLKQGEKDKKKSLIIRYRNSQVAAAAILLLLIGVSIFFLLPETTRRQNRIAHRETRTVILPNVLPPDTGAASSRMVVTRPSPSPPEVKKEREMAFHERNKENPDTMTVVAYKAQRKESLAGSVMVIPALALKAARTSDNHRGMAISGQPDEDTVVISGLVKDAGNGKPLQGVAVRIAGTKDETVSDSAGYFKLALPAGKDSLDFAFIGYETKHIVPGDRTRSLNVGLLPSYAELNEAVVAGHGKEAKKSAYPENKARPSGGFAAFRRYIKDSLRYPADALAHHIAGSVRLSFLVMPDSTFQQITIVKSLGYGCDGEAIRLLRDGPAWYPATPGDTTTQEVNIRFRIKGSGR